MAQEKPDFSGPYKEELSELSEVIDWLWAEHDKSFVEAGDDKVYAFGGNGYILVLDDHKWTGLIELITPAGSVQLKQGETGKITVLSATEDITSNKKVIRDGAAGLKNYYQNRYWSTPRTAATAG
jgi:hypothetical protein